MHALKQHFSEQGKTEHTRFPHINFTYAARCGGVGIWVQSCIDTLMYVQTKSLHTVFQTRNAFFIFYVEIKIFFYFGSEVFRHR